MSLKNKFNRVATDNSQLQEFTDKLCDTFDNGEGGFKPVGGTQLYKHRVTITANYAGDEVIETLEFISTDKNSFVGKEQYQISFISGIYIYKPGTENEWSSTILGLNNNGYLVYYKVNGSGVNDITVYDKPYFLTDTVTPL